MPRQSVAAVQGLGLASGAEARASACVSNILPDVRQLAVPNGDREDEMVLERPTGGFDFPPSETNDQNPGALRYEW